MIDTNTLLFWIIIFCVVGVPILLIYLFATGMTTAHRNKFGTREEGFKEKESVPDGVLAEVIGEKITYPTARNPFMNVLIDEIKYNPTRAPAISTNDPSVNIQLNEFFQTQFINDPTDVFNNTQSQRQFYTMPSTTVPNDQESYQNWLYKIPGKTCKEGGREACALATGSDGGVIPWLTKN
jgi:hypothetical protein